MNFNELSNKLINSLKKYNNILIFIKGSPDPDVMAASFAMGIICQYLEIKFKIVSIKETSLPQNQAIIDELNIPIHFEKDVPDPEGFNAYVILDHQSLFIKGISNKIPCAAHIDHHEPLEEEITPDIKIVTDQVGSTSTILTLILKELAFEINETLRTRLSTALLYGIQTDTNNYKHASSLDYEALSYLSAYSNREIIKDISGLPLSKDVIKLFGLAIKNQIIYKDWLITDIGFINDSKRDSIAIIADFLLEKEALATVIVYSAVENPEKNTLTIDASVRTNNENFDLNELIKRVSTVGGARKFKGAFQVNIDYFINCKDRNLLWQVIKMTTLETIKKQRDSIHIIELKGFYNRLKKKLGDLFKA